MRGESELIQKLKEPAFDKWYSDVFEAHEKSDPDAAGALAWKVLLESDCRRATWLSHRMYQILLRTWGAKRMESEIRRIWPTLHLLKRTNICYAAQRPDLMSTGFAFELFYSPDSTAYDRWILFGCLKESEEQRKPPNLTQSLVNQVGKFANDMVILRRDFGDKAEALASHWQKIWDDEE